MGIHQSDIIQGIKFIKIMKLDFYYLRIVFRNKIFYKLRLKLNKPKINKRNENVSPSSRKTRRIVDSDEDNETKKSKENNDNSKNHDHFRPDIFTKPKILS